MNLVLSTWAPVVAVAIIVLLALGIWRWVRRRRSVAAALGDRDVVARLLGEDLHVLPWFRVAVVMLAGIVLAAALADRSESRGSPVHASRDVVLVLDVSNSMLVEDVSPNRLEVLRTVAHRIVEQLPNDRVGVVAFAGEAVVVTPPTRDAAGIAMYLDAISPAIAAQTGSAFGPGVRQAAALLAAGSPHPGGRVAVLIGDGEPVGTEDRSEVVEAVRRAAALGVIVHTVGVGTTEGGPVPDLDLNSGVRVGYKREPETGEIAISRQHPDLLREISRATRGSYVDASEVRDVDRFLTVLRSDPEEDGGASRFAWLAALALALLGVDAARELKSARTRRST